MQLAVVVVVLVVVLYVGFVLLVGFLEARSRPKVPMFICDKHGAFAAKHAITFSGMEYCPVCFHERLKENPLP